MASKPYRREMKRAIAQPAGEPRRSGGSKLSRTARLVAAGLVIDGHTNWEINQELVARGFLDRGMSYPRRR